MYVIKQIYSHEFHLLSLVECLTLYKLKISIEHIQSSNSKVESIRTQRQHLSQSFSGTNNFSSVDFTNMDMTIDFEEEAESNQYLNNEGAKLNQSI